MNVTQADPGSTKGASGRAPWKKGATTALLLLTLANVFNHLDRQIISILAQSIKADLKLDDAQLGFLLGTAFAVFYSVVGIAMGRISDFLSRKKVLALGLALWSGMTALGGAATSFGQLSLARIGVGVGEAVANPCSHSLLSDIFPARNRSLALGFYLAGTFIGGTGALLLGGYLLQSWSEICTTLPFAGACALPAWKASLFAVGIPGLPLAAALLFIREPERHVVTTASSTRVVIREFAAALPPFTLITVFLLRGLPGLLGNLALAAVVGIAVAALIALTGDAAQWLAFGLGVYAVVTWGQVQKYRDPPLYRLTFGDRTFILSIAGVSLTACIIGALHVWGAPFAMRNFAMTPLQVGLWLGILHMIGAVIGVIVGGWSTDTWKRRDPRAPLSMTLISLLGLLPSGALMVFAPSQDVFLLGYFLLGLFSALWSGGIAALIQDLVLPRMRGSAAASHSLVAIVIASGIGPYWAGKVSTLTGSLNAGLLSVMILAIPAVVVLLLAMKRLPNETPEARLALAASAGEKV